MYHLHGVRVDELQEVLIANVGMRVSKETIIEADFRRNSVFDTDPSDIASDLNGVGARSAAFGVGKVFGIDGCYLTVFVFFKARALDNVTVLKSYCITRE